MTQHFSSDGVDIAYLDRGEGLPILLIHGFASTARINWENTGWIDLLTGAGRRVVAVDNRCHGASEKIRDPALCDALIMAEDSRRLLDHLGIERADIMGYSMGARIATFLAINHPDRVGCLVLGGVGANLIEGTKGTDDIIAGLEAPGLSDVDMPVARAFRKFAEANQSDLKALAACMRAGRPPIGRECLAALRAPVLVAVGSRDDVAGSAEPLVSCLFDAELLEITDRDHMLAVGDKLFKTGVLDFLKRRASPGR